MGIAIYAVTALIIGPLVYFLYQVVAWILEIRSIGQAVEKYPGHRRSLLFGHLHEVSILGQFSKCPLCKYEYKDALIEHCLLIEHIRLCLLRVSFFKYK